jgi:hypothetical protein
VLRDINELRTSSDLRASGWFRDATYLDAKGEARPSFDLTRQAFTLLVRHSPGAWQPLAPPGFDVLYWWEWRWHWQGVPLNRARSRRPTSRR